MGSTHAMILSDTGYVYSFGNNYYGQLGIGNTSDRNRPTRM